MTEPHEPPPGSPPGSPTIPRASVHDAPVQEPTDGAEHEALMTEAEAEQALAADVNIPPTSPAPGAESSTQPSKRADTPSPNPQSSSAEKKIEESVDGGRMAITSGILQSIIGDWAMRGRPALLINVVYHRDWDNEDEPNSVEEAILRDLCDLPHSVTVSEIDSAMTDARRRAYDTTINRGLKDIGVDFINYVVLLRVWDHFHTYLTRDDFPWKDYMPEDMMSGGPDDGFHGHRSLRERQKAAKAQREMAASASSQAKPTSSPQAKPTAASQAKPTSSSQAKPTASPQAKPASSPQTKSTPAAPEANNAPPPPPPSHPPYGGYYGGHPAYSHPGYAYGATPMGPPMQQTGMQQPMQQPGMPPQGHPQAYGFGYDYGVQQPGMPPQGHSQAYGFGYGYGTQPEGGQWSAGPQWRQ